MIFLVLGRKRYSINFEASIAFRQYAVRICFRLIEFHCDLLVPAHDPESRVRFLAHGFAQQQERLVADLVVIDHIQ